MNKNQSTGIVIIVAIILIIFLSFAFEGPQSATSEISYTQFLNKVKIGTIESVSISKDVLINDRTNMIYSGCNVISGKIVALVKRTTNAETQISKLERENTVLKSQVYSLAARVNKLKAQ